MKGYTRLSERRHRITLDAPGAAVPDGDGGYTQTYVTLSPSMTWAAITPATARDLERVTAGTVLSSASHVITFPHHPQVTTQTRITKGSRNADGTLPAGSREFAVTGVSNPEERDIETVCICQEVVA